MLWSSTPAARRGAGPSTSCAGPSPTTRPRTYPKRAGSTTRCRYRASGYRCQVIPSPSELLPRRPSALDAEIRQVDADGEPDRDEREVDGRREQGPSAKLTQEGKDPRAPGQEHVDAYRK